MSQPQDDSCSQPASAPPVATPPAEGRRGRFALIGTIAAGIGASACCWLPPVLLALGVGAAGVGAFFDGLRPYMLGVIAILLVVLFRRAYGRRAACAEGTACATPAGRGRARRMFWSACFAALMLTTYPYWGAALQGGSGAEAGSAAFERAAAEGRRLDVEIVGLTCEACAATARTALVALPEVEDASVDLASGKASLLLAKDADAAALRPRIDAALAEHGYHLAPLAGASERKGS